jgi:hypothetical protein
LCQIFSDIVNDRILVGETLNPGASNGIRVGMQVTSQPRKRHESLDVNLLTPKMNQLTLMVGGERRASLLGVEAIMEEFKKRGGGDVKFFLGIGKGAPGGGRDLDSSRSSKSSPEPTRDNK